MALVDLLVRVRADIGRATAGLMAIDNLTKKVENAMVRNIRSIRRAINGLIASVIKLTAVMGVLSLLVLAKAVSSFAKFEQAIVNSTSVTGKLGEEFVRVKDHLSELAQYLGRTTVFSALQAAEAMYDLASAGVDVANMTKDDMIPILNLAAATQSELKFATETLTSTIAQFGLTIQDTERVSDVLTGTITSTKATIEKMSVALAYVGPIANAAGMSLEETAAALGMLYNAGLPASMAGTALRGALNRLMGPTAGAKDALAELGLTVEQVSPVHNKFRDIITLLGDRGMTAGQALKIFGVRAASGMIALTGASDKLGTLTDQLYTVQGLTQSIADEQLATLKGSFILLKSALEGLMISMGSMTNVGMKAFNLELRDISVNITGVLMRAVGNLMDFLNKLGPTWESMKSSIKSVVGIMGDLAEILGLAGEEGADKLASAINFLSGSVAKFLKFIDEHPAITRFAGAIAIAIIAVVNLAGIVASISAVIAASGIVLDGFIAIMLFGAPAVAHLAATFPILGSAIAALTGPIGWAILAISLFAAAYATNLFGVRDITKSVLGTVKEKFTGLVDFFGNTYEKIANIIIGTWNYLVPIMREMGMDVYRYNELHYTKLEDMVKQVSQITQDENEKMSDSITSTYQNLAEELELAENATTDYSNTLINLPYVSKPRASHLEESFMKRGFMGGEEYIGVGHPDYEAMKAKVESPLDTTLWESLTGGMGNLTANMVENIDEKTLQAVKDSTLVQEEQNQKMGDLEYLKELPDISRKLDDLEIEINNYTTNNYSNRGGSGRSNISVSTNGLIGQTKDTEEQDTLLGYLASGGGPSYF